jgi:hypothetical protein
LAGKADDTCLDCWIHFNIGDFVVFHIFGNGFAEAPESMAPRDASREYENSVHFCVFRLRRIKKELIMKMRNMDA